MARTKVEEPTAGRPAVEVVPLPAVPVVTVGQDSPCWAEPSGVLEDHPEARGAIVRVRPPVVSDAVLDDVVGRLRVAALAVRVEGRRRPAVVPAEALHGAVPAARGARAVVSALVEEAYTDDREALRALVEEIMSEVGL